MPKRLRYKQIEVSRIGATNDPQDFHRGQQRKSQESQESRREFEEVDARSHDGYVIGCLVI